MKFIDIIYIVFGVLMLKHMYDSLLKNLNDGCALEKGSKLERFVWIFIFLLLQSFATIWVSFIMIVSIFLFAIVVYRRLARLNKKVHADDDDAILSYQLQIKKSKKELYICMFVLVLFAVIYFVAFNNGVSHFIS